MTLQARLFVAGLGLMLLMVVLRSVRAQKLRFEYSFLWLALSVLLALLAIFQRTADRFAAWVGIFYPPAFYLLLCFFVVLLILFHLTLRLSLLAENLKELAQAVALLGASDPKLGPPASVAPPEATGAGRTPEERSRSSKPQGAMKAPEGEIDAAPRSGSPLDPRETLP